MKGLQTNIKHLVMKNPGLFARLDANTQALLRQEFVNGQQVKTLLRAVEKELSYAIALGAIGASSTTNLFDTSQARKTGISDFEQGMKVNSDSIICGMKLMYAASANTIVNDKLYTNLLYNRTTLAVGFTDTDTGGAGNQQAMVPALTIPKEFLNADFILKVGGIEKARRKVYQFFLENDRKDYLSGDSADYLSLEKEPIFAAANDVITAELVAPEGILIAAAAAGYHLLRWSVQVSQFVPVNA